MQPSALAARLKTLSVSSVSQQLGAGKCGYICRLQIRVGQGGQEEPYFSVHWAVLKSGCLLLFDSNISQSCSEAICLAGFSLEPSVQPANLWPEFCDQRFHLSSANSATTWHLGWPAVSNFQQHQLRTEIIAAAYAGDAGLDRLLHPPPVALRPPPPPVPTADRVAEASFSTPALLDDENPYDGVEDDDKSLLLAPPPPLQSARDSSDVGSVYNVCDLPETLHSLASSGLTVNFALDYVAAAVSSNVEDDEDSLWHALSGTEPGTFVLVGCNKDQPAQPIQIAVKTSAGFEVECLQIVAAQPCGVSLVGEYGKTFETLEQLVFHYHLHPILRDGSGTNVCLTKALGYDNSNRIPVRTILFASCFWTIGDKDTCSKVLFESTVGSYSLRVGADNNYVLSVRVQNLVAKLVINVHREGDSEAEFSLANGGPSGEVKFRSLEDLLTYLHNSSFPVSVLKNRLFTKLQTPYQNSTACRVRQQFLLLDPLRQQIFHRGSQEQAMRALRLPSNSCGAFVVWLKSATEVCLMVRGRDQRVFVFVVHCIPTNCRFLPERSVYLEKRPEMKFDRIEALVSHLQCNPGLLLPEVSGKLTQPVNCRNA